MSHHTSHTGVSVEQGFSLQFDLFGEMEVRIPKPKPDKRLVRTRRTFLVADNRFTLDLFDLLDVPEWQLPHVGLEEEEEGGADVAIPYVATGKVFLETHNGSQKWSREGIVDLQTHLFYQSLDELGLKNNDLEKASVLRWIFAPAFQHIWKKEAGKIVSEVLHESNNPFSFYNCAIAARVNGEELRDGIRRNVGPEILKSIEAMPLD